MKKILISFALIIICSTSYSQNNSGYAGDAIIGVYWSPKKDGKIEIFQKDYKYFGKLIWGNDLTHKDIHNPEPALRERVLQDLIILSNFYYDPDDKEWKGGTVYDPRSGKTYKSYMWQEGENLRVKGYIGFSFIGRSELFERVKQ